MTQPCPYCKGTGFAQLKASGLLVKCEWPGHATLLVPSQVAARRQAELEEKTAGKVVPLDKARKAIQP